MVVGFVVFNFACGSSDLGLLISVREFARGAGFSSWHPKVLACDHLRRKMPHTRVTMLLRL